MRLFLAAVCAFALLPSSTRGDESMPQPIYKKRPGGQELYDRALPGVTVPAQPGPALEVAPGLYQSDGMSNTWLLVTDEGRIVVNTGMGWEGPVHRQKYDDIDDGPIRYIVFTQGHVDHVGGANAFLEEGTEIIAHADNRSHQALDELIHGYRMAHLEFAFPGVGAQLDAARAGGDQPVQAQPDPTITFRDHHAFSLGGVDLELMWVPGGETNESIIVWLPKQRIAIVGNLFGALFGHVPNLVTIRGDKYRESKTFTSAIERVRALEPEILAVGHHEPLRGAELIARELDRLHASATYVHDETLRYMNDGKDVYTAMAEIHLPPELEVGEGYGKVAWNVRAIWESYVGWFHHLSATQLYAKPPSSIYPDLVELAGIDAVAERARTRLAAGAPVEASHLAEAALASQPRHPAAREVYREAHLALAEASTNFWEISYLRYQVLRSEQQLAP